METEPGGGPQRTLTEDERILHRLGYAQELMRAVGGFGNFAISFTIISILAGCLTSYFIAFNNGGPVAVTWGWLLVGGFCIIVALSMAEIASAMPTAGGLYYWASRLGSPAWGWFTGWFNLIGQISVTAAIDYGAAVFVDSLLNLWFGTSQTATAIFVIFTIIIAAHLLINLAALPILNMINTFSAWWHMVGRRADRAGPDRDPGPPPVGRLRLRQDDQQLGLLRHELREPDLLVRVRDRPADGPVHDHRLRRLRAPLRGDPERGAAARPSGS